MSVTVATMEQELSKLVGDYITLACSSNGAADGSTLLSSSEDISSRPAQSWQRYTVEITSGTADGQVRPVSSVSHSAGVATFTVSPVFSAQIVSAVTARLHRFPRLWKVAALSDALGEIVDVLPRVVIEEFLSGELARNVNFEQWRGNTPYDWELIGSPTVTKETTTIYQGKASCKIAAVASDKSVRQLIVPARDIRSETISFEAYVKGAATNGPYVAITTGGATTNGTAVTSTDWTKVTVTAAISDPAQPVYIEIHKGSSNTDTYFDAAHCKVNVQTSTSVIPISEAITDLRSVEWRRGIDQAASTLQSELDYTLRPYSYFPMPQEIHGGYGHYRATMTRDDFMRVIGLGVWPTVTADSDTVDISLDQVPLIAGRAAVKLLEHVLADGSYGDSAELQGTMGRIRGDQMTKERLLRVKAPTKRITLPLR